MLGQFRDLAPRLSEFLFFVRFLGLLLSLFAGVCCVECGVEAKVSEVGHRCSRPEQRGCWGVRGSEGANIKRTIIHSIALAKSGLYFLIQGLDIDPCHPYSGEDQPHIRMLRSTKFLRSCAQPESF